MIPVRLSLRNFMSYRDNVPPLHFNGIHTASICGSNGHGKSALIDAMTWALWGQSRARRDDDLIHSGTDEVAVEFDFAVEGQEYRILRRHTRPRRRGTSGRTILEFQVATEDGFSPLTGNTIQQTQQRIIDTIHMDYATFTNSAYLRQGHADEFTTANPARRKQVLASILGLSLYDELEARARDLARKRQAEKEQLDVTIREMQDELAQRPAHEAELETAGAELTRLSTEVREHEARLHDLRLQKESLEARQWQMARLDESMEQRRRTLAQWEQELMRQRARITDHEALIARREDIESGFARLTAARSTNEELERKFRRSVDLERQKARLEASIARSSQALLTEHAIASSRIAELETSAERLPRLNEELQQTRHRLSHLAQEEKALDAKKQTSQELRARLQSVDTQQSQLERDIAEITEKLDLLRTEQGVRCPLCETELGAENLELIRTKYTADRQQKSASVQAAQEELASTRMGLQALQNEVPRLEARLRQERDALQGKAGLLGQQIQEAQQARVQLEAERSSLAGIEERLASKDFAAEEQRLLGEIEVEMAALSYDPRRHEEVRGLIGEMERYEEPKRKLDEADRLIDEEKASAARAEQAAAELRSGLEADSRKRQELAEEVSRLPSVTEALSAAEREHSALTERHGAAQQALASARARVEYLDALETRTRERQARLEQAGMEEGVYRELAEAFGKRGVQALLIETALPEIETEANRLLGRMTENRLHVKMETQRPSRTSDTTIETLDINIADELGTRNYEMFSGGEAFRINFAIRIALSRLLARRAGAPLPTLIIDEGFGTQDSLGIERLRDAINSIQDDFDKILVITHIEDLRDAFPTRIDVTKTPEGSKVSFG